jgi:hypothetical protein
MRRRHACPLFFFLLFLAALFPAPPAAGTDTPYLNDLLASARDVKLHDDPYWNILLHYKPAGSGRKSQVDDRRFFLSRTGKTDPAAELEATLSGFFLEENPEKTAGGGEGLRHPKCRFPARFEWLKERLSIDSSRLPEVSCGELDNALLQIRPKSASFIFASAHMNAPASMFGHTFLRVDSPYRSPLLSYAVNYAATIDRRDNGLTYAFKGIFGLYPGYYSILPYYDKVKEYGNMDQRDLWEYRLNLAEEEVRRMVLHIWELQDIYSDYYFFDENCSYDLLFLLEAARPSVSLTDRKGMWVIPVDTLIRVRKAGLIEETVFRPSQVRKIRNAAVLLDEEELRLARAVIDGMVSPEEVVRLDLPPDDKIRILDIASEYTQLRYMKKGLPKEEFQKRFVGILGTRSRMGNPGHPDPGVPVPAPPESGHGSSRLSLSAGVRDEDPFLEASFRPAYHGLQDADEGYAEGSQIEFSSAALRYYPEDGRLRLQRWDLINIHSAAPRDEFFRPVSWKVRTGLETREFASERDGLVTLVSPGGGFSWKSRTLGLTSLLLETELALSGKYEADYTAGVGASLGTLARVTDSWKVLAQARYIYGVLGDKRRGREFSACLRQGIALSRNRALFLDVERTVSPDVRSTEAKLSMNFYF